MKLTIKSLFVVSLMLLSYTYVRAQQLQDSIIPTQLTEVVLIGDTKSNSPLLQQKLLAGVENYLESMPSVGMVKRGAYAWEPTINNMNTERINVTIDGMKIFGACTDKMDPITSYVEVSNLSKAEVSNGQQGASIGNTIGGSMNLILDKSELGDVFQRLNIESGFESNNQLQVVGVDASISNDRYYLDIDAMRRDAENYTAGGSQRIEYSQYSKYNLSLNSGVKLSDNATIEGSFIYDRAADVGYPALPMDVSLAKASIASLAYKQKKMNSFADFESKLYFNTITHIMDDSKRPDVPIRMDMPGESQTLGVYSMAGLGIGEHQLTLKWDAFVNRSYAKMTMYPNDTTEKAMFMLTWPDVLTTDSGLFLGDQFDFEKGKLQLNARVNLHNNRLRNEMGLSSLQIFHPTMEASNSRVLGSLSVSYQLQNNNWEHNFGVGTGNRAPSVSEAYGFYLFNSFDNHDYVGNPLLKNEGSFEGNLTSNFKTTKSNLKIQGSYFFMTNYIIGVVNPSLSKMTIGAAGVKQYVNLSHAQLISSSLEWDKTISNRFKFQSQLSYHRAWDSNGDNLPFIAPLEYQFTARYLLNGYAVRLSMHGAASQNHFNQAYGEDSTNSYNIYDSSLSKRVYMGANQMNVKLGVENIFDINYTTYSDWNNIPRMGRNLFINLSYHL